MKIRKFFGELGPGLITGAADDDPSGISTYSVVGASFGYAQLWTVFLTFPLMSAVQSMCARMALMTGEGLAGTMRRHCHPGWLWLSCALLAIANIVNIGADFAGMAEALEMVTGVREAIWLPVLAVGIVVAVVFWSYRLLARTLKWLTLVLFTYIVAAFLAKPDWGEVVRNSFLPHIQLSSGYLMTLVAVLGTTITPYMFFWQASQEVEEEKAHGKKSRRQRLGASDDELRLADRDVLAGMGWAGLTMYFIMVATAATLHRPGSPPIETAKQAADALRPVAGDGAYWLFALGLIGTGLLAIPVLAGSAAYAIAEAMHWRGSLDDRPEVARKFYVVLVLAVAIGVALDAIGISAVKALFYAAVVNGILAPPLVALVTYLSSREDIMGRHASRGWRRGLGWTASAAMAVAAIAMLASLIRQ